MKYFVLGLLCIILLFGCQPSIKAQDQVFGLGSGLCVITNNTVRFYGYNSRSDKWDNEPSMEFNLPTGYKSVFGLGSGLCVVVNNTVRFYGYNSRSDKWDNEPSMEFIIK